MLEFFVGLLFTIILAAISYAVGWLFVRFVFSNKKNRQPVGTMALGATLILATILVIAVLTGIGTVLLGGPS